MPWKLGPLPERLSRIMRDAATIESVDRMMPALKLPLRYPVYAWPYFYAARTKRNGPSVLQSIFSTGL